MTDLAEHGRRLARESAGLDPENHGHCLWALTVEAAKTIASLPRPGPRGFATRSAMPEGRLSINERLSIEREWLAEGIKPVMDRRFRPSSMALAIWPLVWNLWSLEALANLKIVNDPRLTRDTLWFYAAGAKPRQLGVSRSTLRSWKNRCSERLAIQVYGLQPIVASKQRNSVMEKTA